MSNTDLENKEELEGGINNTHSSKKKSGIDVLLWEKLETFKRHFTQNHAYILCHFGDERIYVLFLYRNVMHLLTVVFKRERKHCRSISNCLLI